MPAEIFISTKTNFFNLFRPIWKKAISLVQGRGKHASLNFGLTRGRFQMPILVAGVFSTLRGLQSQDSTPVRGFPDAPFFEIQAEEGWEFARAKASADACGHVVAGHFAQEWAG